MGWYSLLPPYLTVVETWIIRIAVRLDTYWGFINRFLRVDNLSWNTD